MKGDQFDGLLVVINDVTEELLHAARKPSARKFSRCLKRSPRTAPGSFLHRRGQRSIHAAALLRPAPAEVCPAYPEGQLSADGVRHRVQLCHQAENELADRSAPLPAEAFAPLEQRWTTLKRGLEDLPGRQGPRRARTSTKEIEALRKRSAPAPPPRIFGSVGLVVAGVGELPLGRLGRYAKALAVASAKARLTSNPGPRRALGAQGLGRLLTDLVHVVRNAVESRPRDAGRARKCGQDRTAQAALLHRGQRAQAGG